MSNLSALQFAKAAATANTAKETRPTREIRNAIKKQAFEAALDSILNLLKPDQGVVTEKGQFFAELADVKVQVRSTFNSFFGPALTMKEEDASAFVDAWIKANLDEEETQEENQEEK